jgi:hypothetical protein
MPKASLRNAAAGDVDPVATERVAQGAEEPLPLPRADPDMRKSSPRGDGTPACNRSDDLENELAHV